jgi:signal transduction histidine kinase
VELEQMIAELRGIADELAERSRPKEAADPLGGVARAALAEEVVAVVRHDMRNKLGSIRNAAFFLRRRVQQSDLWEAEPRMSQFFALIEETVVEATTMLEDPLGPTLRPPRRPARVSVRECVELAVACAHVPERVRLRVDAGAGVVEVDRAELALAVRCLLDNAVEASPDGGAVDVSAREDGASVVVAVTDQGAGIPEESIDAVFSSFFTTKDGHAGIGLKIARRIARRNGGDLSLLPALRGTVATLLVPRADRGDRPDRSPVPPSPVPDLDDTGPRTGVRSQRSAGPR